MDSSGSDEEDCLLPFWNNWLPPDQTDPHAHKNVKNSFGSYSLLSNNLLEKNCRGLHSYWIPPVMVLKNSVKRKEKPIQERNAYCETFDKCLQKKTANVHYYENNKSNAHREKVRLQGTGRDEMLDWGERTQLHDVTKFSDGDIFWGVVNLGVFVRIQLWMNDYGNICASADGTITKLGSEESTFISVTNAELVRKILGLSNVQWLSLCETVQEAGDVLKFDAIQEFKPLGKTKLEKLWFLICKRRHFLPDQCMLVELNGAVKCMKKFKITPKVVVKEIRNISGQTIL